MAHEISKWTGAEVLPGTPLEGVVNSFFVRALGGDAEPLVPVERLWDGIGSWRPAFAGEGSSGPSVNFFYFSNNTLPDQCDSRSVFDGRLDLIAHLRDDSRFGGCFYHGAGLRNLVRQRFFTVDVFAALHRGD